MNTALKMGLGILVVIALIAAWMYFSGGTNVQQGENTNGNAAQVPAASGSLDDLNAAIEADVSGSASLTSGNDADAATLSGNTSVAGAAAAVGSY